MSKKLTILFLLFAYNIVHGMEDKSICCKFSEMWSYKKSNQNKKNKILYSVLYDQSTRAEEYTLNIITPTHPAYKKYSEYLNEKQIVDHKDIKAYFIVITTEFFEFDIPLRYPIALHYFCTRHVDPMQMKLHSTLRESYIPMKCTSYRFESIKKIVADRLEHDVKMGYFNNSHIKQD